MCVVKVAPYCWVRGIGCGGAVRGIRFQPLVDSCALCCNMSEPFKKKHEYTIPSLNARPSFNIITNQLSVESCFYMILSLLNLSINFCRPDLNVMIIFSPEQSDDYSPDSLNVKKQNSF